MKQLYYVIMILSLLVLAGCQEDKKPENQFTLSGEIKGMTGNLYFSHPDKDENSREQDTIFIKDGKVSYTGSISELTLIRAFADSKEDEKLFKSPPGGLGYFPVKSMALMFYAFPGGEVVIQGEATDFMNAYPSGDKYNNSLAAINKIAYPYYNDSVNLMLQAMSEKDSTIIEELNNQAKKISNEGLQKRLEHIHENPESLGALWYLEDMLMRQEIEGATAIATFNTMSKDLAEYDVYKALELRISGINDTQEGKQVPYIKTNATLDGSEFDIASLKGKYVLIDFWGTWCGPCVQEMPRLKEFQEEHKDKLVILGINSGDTKEKAKKFLDENGYAWQQLFSSKESNDDNFVNRFNVQGFPTKLIIDPEGKIVKRYVGSGDDAFTLMETLFNAD